MTRVAVGLLVAALCALAAVTQLVCGLAVFGLVLWLRRP